MTEGSIRELINAIASLEQRVQQLETERQYDQLASSSIENGAVNAYDAGGRLRQTIGKQPDETYAITYHSGDPSQAPSTPAVAGDVLSLAIGWDGLMADGTAPASNVQRIDAHMSTEGADFTPTESTAVGSLLTASVLSVTADNQQWWVKLVAVTNAQVPSPPTAAASAVPLPADHIAAGSVDTAQLAAELVLASVIKAKDPSGDTTVLIDGTTGDVSLLGELRTGFSGERISINEDESQEVRFYPKQSNGYARMYASTSAGHINRGNIVFRSPVDDYFGVVGYATFSLDGFQYERRSSDTDVTIQHFEIGARLYGRITQLAADFVDYSTGDSIGRDFSISGDETRFRTGKFRVIAQSDVNVSAATHAAIEAQQEINLHSGRDMNFYAQGSASVGTKFITSQFGEAFISNTKNDVGMVLGNNNDLYVVNFANNAGRRVQASDFIIYSGSGSKVNIRPVPYSSLDIVSTVQAKQWERPVENSATYVGVVADDLPGKLTQVSGNTGESVLSQTSLIGTLWNAVHELSAQVDELSARLAAVENSTTS